MIVSNHDEAGWVGDPQRDVELDMNDVLADEAVDLDLYKELKIADRCDPCGEASQAFVRTVKVINDQELELLWCGHHFAENEPKLVADGWWIQDERHRINSKPMSGDPTGAFDVDD
jgi:hypothetical protein